MLVIYYHHFCNDRSYQILQETIEKIDNFGLYSEVKELVINIVGENVELHKHLIIENLVSIFPKIRLMNFRSEQAKKHIYGFSEAQTKADPRLLLGKHGLELDTLKLMQNEVKLFPGGERILYLHSKGAVHTGRHIASKHRNRSQWRANMLKRVVENWNECVKVLDNKPHVGYKFIKMRNKNHYCGNFWWSTSEHISSNRCPVEYAISNQNNRDRMLKVPFYSAEFWLCNSKYK